MKRIVLFVLTLCLCFSLATVLTACEIQLTAGTAGTAAVSHTRLP